MERLGLADRRKDLVETLSGGLRRRVEIAKALLHRPQVLLMDEASTGLDPAARRDLSRHVENLREQEGVTILLTTHILEEADRCDRLVLLHQGAHRGPGQPGANCGRASAATWWCSKRPTPQRWPARHRRALRRASPRRSTAACASKSPTATASSPKWWRPFPAPSIPWACTSPRWKTSSCTKREPPLSNFFLPAATLWQRELVRFWRQKSRVLGVVASPLVFWLLIGYGSNDLARFYSGALVLTVMFSAIFSTISIIEDRREGFLLSMLVSPAPRTSLVLGKILGSATLAWIQGLIFLASRRWRACPSGRWSWSRWRPRIFLISFTLTGLGFVIAWKMESTAGFHAIMNLLLVPMWMVSGSLFPMATAHGWVKAIMWVNPLTYSIALLNHTLRLPNAAPGALASLVVTAAFGLALLLALRA